LLVDDKDNLWQQGNLGHIDEIIVDKSHRKKGIGKQLLERIVAVAEEKECKRIELDSAFHRKTAHEFYKTNGFEDRAFLYSKPLND
jgi:GNAT superfamily N-acetyltransferase